MIYHLTCYLYRDTGKLCVVTEDAFFSLLEMNGINLSTTDKKKLAK